MLSAIESIKNKKPDVVFLDIEMPNYAGFEIVSFFKEIDFEIIFVTAYDKYAIKAFEISAVDYLLKPIDISRLKEAVIKLEEKLKVKSVNLNYNALSENLQSKKINNLIIPFEGNHKAIKIDDIVAIEAQEAYSCIHTNERNFLVSKNLKHFESVLEDNSSFFRTHKSWIVNVNHMINYSKSKFEINLSNSITAKLSKYKKSDFEVTLNQ